MLGAPEALAVGWFTKISLGKFMDNFYFVSWRDAANDIVAYAPKGMIGSIAESQITKTNELPFPLTIEKDAWLDYLPNSLGWPIMSVVLKDLIDNRIYNNNILEWINIIIESPKSKRTYYSPRFTKNLDFIDEEKSIFAAKNHLVKPVLSRQKIGNLELISLSGLKIGIRIIISNRIKEEILTKKLTGMIFTSVPIN
jgi:hypothetical protein